MPHTAIAIAAVPDFLTNLRSVSIPVSSNNIRMPICDSPSTMPFWASSRGKKKCCAPGHSQPNRDGPKMIPPSKVPISAGWPMRCMPSPSNLPTTRSNSTSATSKASFLPLPVAPLPAVLPLPATDGLAAFAPWLWTAGAAWASWPVWSRGMAIRKRSSPSIKAAGTESLRTRRMQIGPGGVPPETRKAHFAFSRPLAGFHLKSLPDKALQFGRIKLRAALLTVSVTFVLAFFNRPRLFRGGGTSTNWCEISG